MASPIARYHGKTFEVTVIGCTGLKDTEWFKKQRPYVHLEYGSTKWTTRSCPEGDTNPTFQQKFLGSLIGGVTEMTVQVWTRKTLVPDRFIGSGKVPLVTLISDGLDNRSWTIVDKLNKHSGEVKLLLYCEDLNKNQHAVPPLMNPPPYPSQQPPPYPPQQPPPYPPPAPYPPQQPPPYQPYPPRRPHQHHHHHQQHQCHECHGNYPPY